MAGVLEREGFAIADAPERADVIVINSCTVKDRTWHHFRQRLADLRAAARAGLGPAPVVAGCVPPAHGSDPLLEGLALIGPDSVGRVAEAVRAALAGAAPRLLRGEPGVGRASLPARRRNPLVEILPIASGCLSACTFCQTRLARGRLRSFAPGELVARARRAVAEGAREIWLTAQDTGAWGRELGLALPGLLREICAIEGDIRVRLGMSSPRWVHERLPEYLDALAHPRMFRFLHVPLQSGSERVLAAMRRDGSAEQFEQVARAFAARFPEGTLMTDIIVGYPTETEADFEATLALLGRLGVGIVNRSRFSPRPGTAAARLDSLPAALVTERSRRLEALVRPLARAWHERRVGTRARVLTIERARRGATLAHDDGYRPIFLAGDPPLGAWLEVEITAAADYHLKGRA